MPNSVWLSAGRVGVSTTRDFWQQQSSIQEMSKHRDFWQETNNSQGLFFQDLGMKSRDNFLADLHEMSYSRARHTHSTVHITKNPGCTFPNCEAVEPICTYNGKPKITI